jgi:hypothetical protein
MILTCPTALAGARQSSCIGFWMYWGIVESVPAESVGSWRANRCAARRSVECLCTRDDSSENWSGTGT